MDAAPDLAAAADAARAVVSRFHSASDDELLADVRVIEQLGRVVDGLRIAGAAQVEVRSRKTLGEESLSFRNGARDGVELAQRLAGISHSTAKGRVGLGSALAPRCR